MTCECGNSYAYGHYDNRSVQCPYCGKVVPVRAKLLVNKNQIILEPGKSIYTTHLDKYSSDYNRMIGKVIRNKNKNNPSIWGIKLRLEHDIEVMDKSGLVKKITKESGVIPIVANLKIQFDDATVGEIKKID